MSTAQQIGVPSESRAGETRVAATPKTVEQLRGLGYEVVVESGAGARASFADAAYEVAGARVASQDDVWASDLVLKINAPSDEEIARLRDGAILASLVSPAIDPDLVAKLAARRITVLAMDAVPRISRAQSLDVLSSMANIAGYRAVIEAAHEFGSLQVVLREKLGHLLLVAEQRHDHRHNSENGKKHDANDHDLDNLRIHAGLHPKPIHGRPDASRAFRP